MTLHPVVSREEWVEARKRLLEREKEFTRERDLLSEERRSLPWVRLEKNYEFETEEGRRSLSDLFDGRSQLVVYHFMFGPDWKEGCKSCSFWADSFNGITDHLKQRDISLVAIWRAPPGTLMAFRDRMGWSFPWASSLDSEFNFDFGVSFDRHEIEAGHAQYNYATKRFLSEESPGASVFFKDENGAIYHTYSTYARGLDLLNTAYNFIDLTPKGRDEDELEYTMAWVKLRDRYEPA